MNARFQLNRREVLGTVAAAVISVAAYSGMAFGEQVYVMLSGAEEMPAIKTSASANGKITVNADMTVSGSITTSGMAGTGAHIHSAPKGKNGPVLITLTKSGDNTWSVPAGAKLTDAQYKSYKAGELYINVHSADHKGGEIRGQLKP